MARTRRWPLYALMIFALIIGVLLAWGSAEPTNAKPGYTCNPEPGHGTSGCHVTVTTAPPTTQPPTTAPPTTQPPTTQRPNTPVPTTQAPTTKSSTSSGGSTKSGTSPSDATAAPTAVDESTSTSEDVTTTSEDSTTTTGDSDDPNAALVGAIDDIDAGGGGPGAGWIVLTSAFALLALAGWAGMAMKSAQNRRAMVGRSPNASEPVRFVLAERLAHWFYASCFLAAGISGALMWIPATAQWMGMARYTVSQYHGYVGLAMVFIPLVIFVALDRKRLIETRRAIEQWDSNDRRWLWAALTGGMFLRSKKMPPQGRFNAGQKVNSHLVAGLAIGFVFTGVLLLMRLHLPYWLTTGVLFAHEVLAVTGGVMLLGHMGMALLTRHGRGGLRAMLRGTMSRDVAREGHALWYAEWLKQKRAEENGPIAEDPTA